VAGFGVVTFMGAVPLVRVRADGVEVDASPRLAFVITLIHGEVNSCYHKKETRPSGDNRQGHFDRCPATRRSPGNLGRLDF
jgi:hypothetical protein